MFKSIQKVLFFCLVLLGCSILQAKVNVVATTLDLADFVQQVGGGKVEVTVLSKGTRDLHYFEPRPSHVLKLKRADMLVILGMDADLWIQSLIDSARNSKIRFGQAGYVDASNGIAALDVPHGQIDASMGDVHPHGNPHYWFTPSNVGQALENITNGLSQVDPVNMQFYRDNKNNYLNRVQSAFHRLTLKLKPYAGTKVLQFHESWNYFCQTFGLELAGSLEPKPGIDPSPAHLQELIRRIKKERIPLLLVEPYYPSQPIRFLEKHTQIKALKLPLYLKGSVSYLQNLESIVQNISQVLRSKQ